MAVYEVETYITDAGKAPFETWLRSLKDPKARLSVFARIDRAAAGDFGDWKAISGARGVFEMRIHYAQGYRLFYAVIGQKVVLLLAGSTKQDQDRAIEKARGYLADYQERTTK